MCCDTTMCGEQSEAMHSLLPRLASGRRAVNATWCSGRSGRHDVSRGSDPEVRRLSKEIVNPVRLCARRRLVGVAVAWAAPLFSDHAPKEVHLWQ
jgi:hypothetical protein